MTLLTAYGESGRSGFVSRIGSSSGYTWPYSSLEPITRKRAFEPSCRIASSRFIWLTAFVASVSDGVSQEAATKLCAARCTM